eukprot:Gb_37249 [translate_table: standard]
MAELTISPTDSSGKAGDEQQAAGVGILLQIMMLVLAFVLGHVLRRHKFYYLHEASASLLIEAPTLSKTTRYKTQAVEITFTMRMRSIAIGSQPRLWPFLEDHNKLQIYLVNLGSV